MGKIAGHLKRAAYGLRRLTGKGLKVAGTVATGLGLASSALSGLQSLVNPAWAIGGGLLGNSFVKGALSYIPVVGGAISTASDIASKSIADEMEANATDRELGGMLWGAAGVGLRKLGSFIEPDDTIFSFKGLLFDKYQIDKVEKYDRVYLSCKTQPQTCMISYINGPIWKCSMSVSFNKRDVKITLPNKGDMIFKFNFDIIGCKIGKLTVTIQKRNDEKTFVIQFDKYQPRNCVVLGGMAVEIKF